ncbi:beta-1,6-galactofuranosyltransferase [Paraglaciecola sp. L3A3]|uniref:beta-1,6-galactofuranosyltransferase n=1 Tax=Paraglaciecola sp. L3A3 TaxID=2686358 RepID=UPI00131DD5B7|nr:beta-1,6-galactofuranosyltransferase [Paraglaciecola sp. L3A3]
MTDKVFISRNYRGMFGAAGKAKIDCETILTNQGWRNLGFKQTWVTNSLLGTLISALGVTWGLIRLKRHSYVCLQYPFNKFFRYCVWGAEIKKCKIVTIVHDVRSLKGKYEFSQKEMDLLNRCDQLIIHNPAMRRWFEEQSIQSQLFEIGAFDYLHTAKVTIEKKPFNFEKLRIVFAGNIGSKQSFVYELDTLESANYCIDLYGTNFYPNSVKDNKNSILNYKGVFPADEVIDRIDGDFGLVWYGESLDSCDGLPGKYLKYNNPHKLSLYVLCGMPIIIWDKAAMADFVVSNGIGFTISSLNELPAKMKSLQPEDYARFKTNAAKIKQNLEAGEFLRQSLEKAEQALADKNWTTEKK